MENRTYRISTYGYATLEDKIKKLNTRAKRLKAPLITLNIIGQETEFKKDGSAIIFNLVTVEGERPKLNGWTFVATIQHTGGSNIIHAVPGNEVPAEYRNADHVCDHCGTARFRVNTYLLRNDGGKYMQVGKNCLADFLGHASPQFIASYAEMLIEADETAEKSTNVGNYAVPHELRFFDLKRYMPFVAQTMLNIGWISKNFAYEFEKESTASYSWTEFIKEMNGSPKKHKRIDYEDITQEAFDMAEKAVEWAKKLDERNNLSDYLHNLHTLAKQNIVDWKTNGMVASIINAYQRDMELIVKRERVVKEGENSAHFGTIGKRETFDVTVLSVKIVESFYGSTRIHRMLTNDGNIAIWFSSNKCLKEGQSYKLKATVKEHSEFNGTKQTVFSRCAEA